MQLFEVCKNFFKNTFKNIFTEKNIIILTIIITLIIGTITAYNVGNIIKTEKLRVQYGITEKLNDTYISGFLSYSEYLKTSSNELVVLHQSSTKTYMDYRAITHQGSVQWDMIYNQKLFKITVDGYLITDDGYYAVALGSYFGELGSKYIMVLDTGIEIPVCKLDAKADIHTNEDHYSGSNANDIIEFIIDDSKMDYARGNGGYVYNGNFNNCELFTGNVVKIIVVE